MRIDAGYGEGDAGTQHYDNLIAQVLPWASDRAEGPRRSPRGPRERTGGGVRRECTRHPAGASQGAETEQA